MHTDTSFAIQNNERKSSIVRWVLVRKAFSTSVDVRSKKTMRNRVVCNVEIQRAQIIDEWLTKAKWIGELIQLEDRLVVLLFRFQLDGLRHRKTGFKDSNETSQRSENDTPSSKPSKGAKATKTASAGKEEKKTLWAKQAGRMKAANRTRQSKRTERVNRLKTTKRN